MDCSGETPLYGVGEIESKLYHEFLDILIAQLISSGLSKYWVEVDVVLLDAPHQAIQNT